MCIIIDANKIHNFFNSPPDADSRPIHDWIIKKGGIVVYSTENEFKRELGGTQRLLMALFSGAKTERICSEKINIEQKKLKKIKKHKSDDVHILALAKASGARLLYTADQDLMKDFKNEKIINHPRGKIYSNAKNVGLLRKDICKPTT